MTRSYIYIYILTSIYKRSDYCLFVCGFNSRDASSDDRGEVIIILKASICISFDEYSGNSLSKYSLNDIYFAVYYVVSMFR